MRWGMRGVIMDSVDVAMGKVETPPNLALYMVEKLFSKSPPTPSSRVLDAGCGSGVFIDAVVKWCVQRGLEVPELVGVEIDPELVNISRNAFRGMNRVKIIHGDFLSMSSLELGGKFDYVISNPPYVSYEKIPLDKRVRYRMLFKTSKGRFDMYMLFFEKGLELLRPGGKLVYITPEKWIYVLTAKSLRQMLCNYFVEEIELVDEDIFGDVLAYPMITVVWKIPPAGNTIVKLRDGRCITTYLPSGGESWLTAVLAMQARPMGPPIRPGNYVLRISPGVATGFDKAFILSRKALQGELRRYAYPAVSGAELSKFRAGETIDYSRLDHVILVPYNKDGRLLDRKEIMPLVEYLARYRTALKRRYVVRVKQKPWYAFHEDPPLMDILKPKILWPDISLEPRFYIDREGKIIPMHSVYYLVPKDEGVLTELVNYLNSDSVKEWLRVRCQRAANGYLRLQSHIIKELFSEGMSWHLGLEGKR
jgi:SAM-dependent methyltransferase